MTTPAALDAGVVQSIHSSAADIQRLVLLITISGKASRDRKGDIMNAANRILKYAENLL